MEKNELSSAKKPNFIDRYFGISKSGSTIAREIIAGVIVFLAMIYILPTNSTILGSAGMDYGAVFAATAICSALATLFMGLFAKFPVALSAGMGMNAFIAYTVCGTMGYSWQESLTLILVSGILFFILTLTPLRTKIINCIPKSIKIAISAGLGAFICIVGLANGGIIVNNTGTIVGLGDLTNPTVLLSLLGVVLVFVCLCLKGSLKKFAIIIAMVITALVGLILGWCGVSGMPEFGATTGKLSNIGNVVGECFKHFDVMLDIRSYAVIFSLIFVNLFDTTGTLLAVGKDAGILDSEGQLIGGKKAMLADAGGAVVCGILGTSTVTSFAESAVGVQSGGKTGLSATTTGVLFLLSLLIYPLFSIFAPVGSLSPVTSMALVAVGAMMFGHIRDIDWDDGIIVFTTFIIIIFMLLTYSISKGLGIGLILYCLMMLAAKRGKEVNIIIYLISSFFLVDFVLETIIPLL